jgi:cation-transporting ATPase 13A1
MAGKLDACLFDKTGTLTTDELVPVGVLGVTSLGIDLTQLAKTTNNTNERNDDAENQLLTPMTKLSHEASLVLAGCHSLVLIDGETTGDPLESAALKSMRWEVTSDSGNVVPSASTEKKQGGSPFKFPNSSPSSEIEILCRHHFSSKLQRMSCVVKDVANRRYYSVVKGSPEMVRIFVFPLIREFVLITVSNTLSIKVGKLLAKKPKEYDDAAKYLSRRGYRVISLAYKQLSSMEDVEAAKDTRGICEEKLAFAGCVAFTCRVRRDTKLILQRLKEGGMTVAMVTGDALLTAIHVAKEVDICDSDNTSNTSHELAEKNKELRQLLEKRRAENCTTIANGLRNKKIVKPILILEQDKSGDMFWQSYEDDSRGSSYVASDVPFLAKSHDLAVTGSNLATAYEFDPITKSVLEHFKVFARMTPDAKETVIECLHSVGKLCLMCGDGANDVGALKQADVGVALLSGFGDVNVANG